MIRVKTRNTWSGLFRTFAFAFAALVMVCAISVKSAPVSAALDLEKISTTVLNAVSTSFPPVTNADDSNVLGRDIMDLKGNTPLFSEEQLSSAFVVPAAPEGKQLHTVTNVPLSMGDRIIVAGGTGSKNAVGTPSAGMDIPVNATVTPVQYPAELFPIGKTTYDDSVAIGVADMTAKLEEQGGCATLQGYSQGARVSGDVANAANNPCVTGVNIGDPRTPGTGLEINMPKVLPGATMTGERGETASHQVYICREWDPICAFPQKTDPVNLANALAGYFKNHPDYANVDEGDRVVKTDGKDTYITLKDSNGVAPLVEVLRDAGLSSPAVEGFINEILEPAEIGTNVQPSAPAVSEPTQYVQPIAPAISAPAVSAPAFTAPVVSEPAQMAIDNGMQMLETVAPPQIADQVQTWVDQGTQMIEDYANGSWTNEAPATHTELPAYESYSAPVAQVFDAPVQQIQEVVNNTAPQMAPMVDTMVQQGMAFASTFMGGV